MNVNDVARRLEPLFPALDEDGKALSLALYRKLARGEPVELNDVDAARRLREWTGVYYDSQQRVIGYCGLSLAPMRHRLRVNGRELFAWCAWDTLFLPAVLDTRIEVASTCRGTGEAVRLSVSPWTVDSAEPAELQVSFIVPEGKAVRADVVTSFCHYVHFFVSEKAAGRWCEEHSGALLLSLADAFELGQLLNRRRYGAMLASP